MLEHGWMRQLHKMEAILISGQKIVKKMDVTIGGTRIVSKSSINYLGMIIDNRLSFKEHMKYIGEKASVTQGALGRIMPNIGGPGPLKRRIISAIGTSIMLYACLIWPQVLP